MSNYEELQARMDRGETLVLDGAICTQIQAMGAPMHPVAWCAEALFTHPYTVQQMHEAYIRAGADIVTTNSFSSNRDVLEYSGRGTRVREAHIRSVHLAQEAIEGAANGRSVYIAGAMSNRHVGRDPRTGALEAMSGHGHAFDPSAKLDHYKEMAENLAESGVDFLLLENLSDQPARKLSLEAAKTTGLPIWSGFSLTYESEGKVLVRDRGRQDPTLDEAMDDVLAMGGISALVLLHAEIDDTTAGLEVMRDKWSGPIAAYPDSRRPDFLTTWRDGSFHNLETPQQLLDAGRKWVDMGVQVIGGCCGFGPDYIEPLRDGLQSHISAPRRAP